MPKVNQSKFKKRRRKEGKTNNKRERNPQLRTKKGESHFDQNEKVFDEIILKKVDIN